MNCSTKMQQLYLIGIEFGLYFNAVCCMSLFFWLNQFNLFMWWKCDTWFALIKRKQWNVNGASGILADEFLILKLYHLLLYSCGLMRFCGQADVFFGTYTRQKTTKRIQSRQNKIVKAAYLTWIPVLVKELRYSIRKAFCTHSNPANLSLTWWWLV